MIKSIYLLLTIFSLTLSFSCEDSATDEFNEVNGDVTEKLVKSISVISVDDPADNSTIIMSYENNKLSNISDGTDTSYLIYHGNSLSTITGQGENFSMEELYQSPYDAFETGEVLEYDSYGNPYKLLFFEEIYDYSTNTVDIKEYTAEITYDTTHNPYFYSLRAAGLIDAMDKVQFNLSINPQPSQIIKARLLFPSNNPSKVIYKDENGAVVFIIDADYVYDNENYPKSASVKATSIEENTISFYITSYTYIK